MEARLKQKSIVTIDMGGTKILAAVVNSKDGIIARAKTPTKSNSGANSYIKSLADITFKAISNAGLKKSDIRAVCLGIPGSVNPHKGVIGLAPNLGLKNFEIKNRLQKKIPFPVLIENDVNLGALGVQKFGVGKKSKNLLAIFVGTGIGGALIFDGKMYRGTDYIAGEIGHMIIEENGPVCGCGKKGCFEALASRTSIVRNILNDKRTKKESIIGKIVPPGEKIKSGALAEAVRKNDKIVLEHLTNACNVIGMVTANACSLLNVDTVVFGGGLIEALGKTMLPIIQKSFNKFVFAGSAKSIKIIQSKLGDDAAIYGGVALAEEFLRIKV
ncbi:MAG: ROK family protein [Ignavibacteriaceae bacterium]|nr:ROK family protein [Ignavibacteriaceae bacterium]